MCQAVVKILEAEDRTGAIGEECVTCVFVRTASHPRKDVDICKLIFSLIKSDTVCGKSYGKTGFIKSVFRAILKSAGARSLLEYSVSVWSYSSCS